MAIAHQPATAPVSDPARRVLAHSPHELVAADRAPRARTVTKLVGLIAVTALGLALALAVVLGTALFALFNLGG